MDFFSIDSAQIGRLVCPSCRGKDASLKLFEGDGDYSLYCSECSVSYPIRDVIYFTEKCNPKECNLECSKVCPENAFYFKKILPGVKSNRIHINESCVHCGKCADACPRNALVKVKTPILYPCGKNKFAKKITLRGGKVTEVSELNCLKGRLRPLDESKLVPSTYLTFEYLSGKMMENHVDGLLLDDGCGSHNFKAFLEGRADAEVFGVDVRVDHYAYYPVNVIADSERLPIKSGSMDSVSSNFVLEHTVQPAVYLSEVRRVLKKGSVAFVSVPTPYYHLAYFFCLEGWVKYLLQVVNNPVKFLRNPAKHFLVGRAHEKEWSVDSRENVTFLDEIRRWRTKNWEKLFDKSNLNVVEEKVTGNPLSLNRGLSKKLGNSKEYGVHRTYTLR